MSALIISLILAVISYFTSKKAGASDGTAALIAAGTGAGAYYVGTQTEWGRSLTGKVTDWFTPQHEGEDLLDANGSKVVIPRGAEVEYDEGGTPVRDANGNIVWKLLDEAGNVLENWGPGGTAGVIQSRRIVDVVKDNIWPIVIGGGLLLLVLRR